MSTFPFNSAGVSTREIDLSSPGNFPPSGVPAGVIGTSDEGPAFVPLTFGDITDFKVTFGDCSSGKFGPLAVDAWLNNSPSVTFLRVLGVGDGKQRQSNGNVTNAGFTVGDRIVQKNGLLADNPHANSGVGAVQGRTYFLGCFMSESNGSTIFSDAGIQQNAGGVETASFTPTLSSGIVMGGTDYAGIASVASITFAQDGASTVTLSFTPAGSSAPAASGNNINVRVVADIEDLIDRIILAINGTTSAGNISYDSAVGVPNVTGTKVDLGGGNFGIKLNYNSAGALGNSVKFQASHLNLLGSGNSVNSDISLSGGVTASAAVPILRGVLLAPSGVILHLSGNDVDSSAPSKAATASVNDSTVMGRKGAITGSVNLSDDTFTLIINGLKNPDMPNEIKASFDPTHPLYFKNKFNTNPINIESEGHYLHACYDIYPSIAKVTGSGVVKVGVYSKGKAAGTFEDIALLLTSSTGRGEASSDTQVDYESFNDRFSAAKSPFIISQGFGGAKNPINLFRIHALSDGEGISQKYKFTIKNIIPSNDVTNPYGSFTLEVRDFNDTDRDPVVLESHPGVDLNPSSDKYIARVIGDQNIKYNFDVSTSAQKLIVEGTYPVLSRYIRVEMANDVNEGNSPKAALPMGYRGPNHLVTSGSLLSNEDDSRTFLNSDVVTRLVEPPIPYREKITLGTGILENVENKLCWGAQFTRKEDPTQPNSKSLHDLSFANAFTKFFPTHRTDTLSFSVGNNPGAQDRAGTVLDSDRFNNNKFTLENIRVKTGSNGKADNNEWDSAVYVRNGDITINDVNKTRAFEVSDLTIQSNQVFAKFNIFLQGGFDGVNIFNADKKALSTNAVRREMDDTAAAGVSDSTVAAYRKAVDILGSKADVDIQLLTIPGIRHPSVTDFAISKVEERFDAMYIMDIEERDALNTIVTSSVQKETIHIANTVSDFKNRALDSSFAAAYFPDVTMFNPDVPNSEVVVPPSVVVLGAYSNNDRVAHPWFAPAGFTRGVLDGMSVTVNTNRANLDELYDADINPITVKKDGGNGPVIMGQKTLQAANSALDRVNVRRLLIDIRRKVRKAANELLFEPNRVETLERFNAKVNPVLQKIQEEGGVRRFKVIVDTTTTTDADIENNTIRGKIFLQPVRSIEFVSLDFEVKNRSSFMEQDI